MEQWHVITVSIKKETQLPQTQSLVFMRGREAYPTEQH